MTKGKLKQSKEQSNHQTICRYDTNVGINYELKPGVLSHLEGCDGVGGGREAQEGGNIHISMAYSC